MMRIAIVLSFIAGFALTAAFGSAASGQSNTAEAAPVPALALSPEVPLRPAQAPLPSLDYAPSLGESDGPSVSEEIPKSDEESAADDGSLLVKGDSSASNDGALAAAVETAAAVSADLSHGTESEIPADTKVAKASDDSDEAAEAEIPSPPPSVEERELLAGVDLLAMELSDGKYRQHMDDGREILFTMDTELQRYADSLFDQYGVPAAAAVVLNSRTGRVLALSQKRHASEAAPTRAVALDPSPPAASVFKIITAAALMDSGVPLAKETCYAGGSSGLNIHHLDDPLPKNHACVSVITALGRSVNAVFAKLSDKYLTRRILERYAARFGFNRPLDFDIPFAASTAEIPVERLERARTAAGFWHTHLSPLHGATIMQSLAQGGAMLRPYVVDRVIDASGNALYEGKPKYLGHTVSKETAAALRSALVYTTERGTARKSFHDAAGRAYLPGIDVAGKTGTLTGATPYRAYTWFVGAAPSNNPEVAVAVLVVNTPKWRIKAPQAAAMILKKYFDSKKTR